MKQNDLNARAKARWGGTAAYKEYEEKTAGQSPDALRRAGDGLMEILSGFGGLRVLSPGDEAVQARVTLLQDYITARFYTCTDEVLAGLGRLYAAGGEYTEAIDRAGGPGTAAFAAEAIACRFR